MKAFASTQRNNTILWHSRMGHPSNQSLRHISQVSTSISYYKYFFMALQCPPTGYINGGCTRPEVVSTIL